MRMKSILGGAIGLLALAPFVSSQSLNLTGPQVDDYFVHENDDGSIFAADAHGTYHFATFQDYVLSSFFQEHGLRCGTDRLPTVPSFGGTTADCSNGNTTVAAEYDVAGGTAYVIPVVFHVLHRTNGTGNVSDALINAQMAQLNSDFAGSGINFTLAGTPRTANNSWYNDAGTYYDTLAWDTTRYLNIYTNQAGGNLGYAYVPSGGGVVGNNWDRVVLLWRTVGGETMTAPYGPPYDLGRSAVHEVGHYLASTTPSRAAAPPARRRAATRAAT